MQPISHSELKSARQRHNVIRIDARLNLLQPPHIVSPNAFQILVIERIIPVNRRVRNILTLRNRRRPDSARRFNQRVVECRVVERIDVCVVNIGGEVCDGAGGWESGVGTFREHVGKEGLDIVGNEGAGVEG